MTYNENDPNKLDNPNYARISDPAYANRNPNVRADDDRSYAGWIIGGLVAAAVILGFMFVLPMTNTNTANNNNNGTTASSPVRPAVPPASTTGSGAMSPAPATPTPTPAPNR